MAEASRYLVRDLPERARTGVFVDDACEMWTTARAGQILHPEAFGCERCPWWVPAHGDVVECRRPDFRPRSSLDHEAGPDLRRALTDPAEGGLTCQR